MKRIFIGFIVVPTMVSLAIALALIVATVCAIRDEL